jgi:TonB family protein
MTTIEQLKRIGSQELKKRLGPNLVRGLIASVFIHSAVVSIGLFEWGEEAVVERPNYDTTVIELEKYKPKPEKNRYAPPVKRFKKPVLPDVEIPIPVDDEPEFVEEIEEKEIDKDKLLEGKYLADLPDSLLIDGEGTGGGVEDLEGIQNTAGIAPPWERDFRPYEIPPVALSTNPRPEFPSVAAIAGITGKVRVWVLVGTDGAVHDWNIIDVTAPNFGFEEAVEEIIEKWKFTPAIQGSSAVEVWVNIPFTFKLKK